MADATRTARDGGALGRLLEAFPLSAGAFVGRTARSRPTPPACPKDRRPLGALRPRGVR